MRPKKDKDYIEKSAYLRKWQHRLRLDDWDISFGLINKFPKSPSMTGTVRISPNFREARIAIKRGMPMRSFRRTVVHELLHIRFGLNDYDENSSSGHLFEVGIEMVARILLGEKRWPK